MEQQQIISLDVSTGPYAGFVTRICDLGQSRSSSSVCVANVHMVIEAWRDRDFAKVVNAADLVTPDGMPLTWTLRLLHGTKQERVAGMDLMPSLLHEAGQRGLAVYFYGSTELVLTKVTARARHEHPALEIAGTFSPPFRPLASWEDEEKQPASTLPAPGLCSLLLAAPGKNDGWRCTKAGSGRS